MTKLTQNKTQDKTQDQGFAYHLGKDIANLELSISELLKIKQGEQSQILKVVVPASIGKYLEHSMQIEVSLPEEFRNAICIEYSEAYGGSSVSVFNTERALLKPLDDVEQVYYLKKLIGIEEFKSAEVKVATISQEELAKINQEIEAKRQ